MWVSVVSNCCQGGDEPSIHPIESSTKISVRAQCIAPLLGVGFNLLLYLCLYLYLYLCLYLSAFSIS
jgi:hypothetical protein